MLKITIHHKLWKCYCTTILKIATTRVISKYVSNRQQVCLRVFPERKWVFMYLHEQDQTFYTCLLKPHNGIPATMIQQLTGSKTLLGWNQCNTDLQHRSTAFMTQSMQKRLGIEEVNGIHLIFFFLRKNKGLFHAIPPSRTEVILLLKLRYEQW